MSKALARALDDRSKAEAKIEGVLKDDYPVNASVVWKRNGLHDGIVIQHGCGDRIKVRNVQSGRELWIYAYCIVDALDKK